jgi:hypothetical protein
MGITYQAQIDIFRPATKLHSDLWQPVSRWELQKDYAFSKGWFEISKRGWPNDVYLIGEGPPDPEYGYDLDSKTWGEGELFILLEPAESFTWFFEAREHVKRLLHKGYKVRVLIWQE